MFYPFAVRDDLFLQVCQADATTTAGFTAVWRRRPTNPISGTQLDTIADIETATLRIVGEFFHHL